MKLKCEICGKIVDKSNSPPVEIPSQKTCLCSYECCQVATEKHLRAIGKEHLISWHSEPEEPEQEFQLTFEEII